ncbi:MAG TPA: bifunctional pyr operon transcriptional regulator/uracil phosphoribosyltransferase PyrR [Lacunisphaera sp.]
MGTPQQYDSKTIDQAIERVAFAIAGRHRKSDRLLLLGIANGGIVFAARLVERLKKSGLKPGLGTIDISFHRDDIGHQPIPKEFCPTFIPHDVNGATVVLVDDVLYSGRTVKAALDELFDHGRPTGVELAILADRGGRKLPIAPDYCGMAIATNGNEKVVVHLDPADPRNDSITVLATSVPRGSKPESQKSKTSSRALAS